MKKMSEYEPWNRYIADDLQPVKNRIFYAYRILIKTMAFVIFGTGSVFLGIVIFPLLRFFFHPVHRFRAAAHRVVSMNFKFFVGFLQITGVSVLETADKKKFKNLHSSIIVANHPSLLDVVYLISLIPNADCIVNGALSRGILAGVVRQIYILNHLGFGELKKGCMDALRSGSNLIIFPEGTRTPRHGENPYKKGAARIALESGCRIVPVHIGGTDKYGLGKHDPFFSFNHTDKYVYKIEMKKEISPQRYVDFFPPVAAKKLTGEIYRMINY